MTPDPNEVDVMGEAHNEAAPRGKRRDFDQRKAGFQDPLPHQIDVEIECGNRRMLQRLPTRKDMLDLLKEIVTQPDNAGTVFELFAEARDASLGPDTRLGIIDPVKRQHFTVGRQPDIPCFQSHRLFSVTLTNPPMNIHQAGLRPKEQPELSLALRHRTLRR
jgi:hypothetical protein